MFSTTFRKTGVVVAVLAVSSVFLFSSSLKDRAEAAGRHDAAGKPRMQDPVVSFHFGLELNGAITGYFTECSGLGSENEITEHLVVDESGREIVRKIPGRLRWADITCRRGITSDLNLWDWREQVATGDVQGARKNGSIVMFDQELREVSRWDFVNGWPSRITAGSGNGATEEVTIVHEGLMRTN